MIWNTLAQYNDVGLLLLRAAIGVIFVYHAIPKLKHPSAMAQMFGGAPKVWIPIVLGAVELLAGLGVILGVYLQLSALLLAIVMFGAIGMKIGKWHVPFSARDKMGWEFDLILFAGALAILLGAGGSLTLF